MPENVCYYLTIRDNPQMDGEVAFLVGDYPYAEEQLNIFTGGYRVVWVTEDGTRTYAWVEQLQLPRGTVVIRRFEDGAISYHLSTVAALSNTYRCVFPHAARPHNPKRVNFINLNVG